MKRSSVEAVGRPGASQRERDRGFWKRYSWQRVPAPSDGLTKRSLVPRRRYVLRRRGKP